MNPEADVAQTAIQGEDSVTYPAGWMVVLMRVLCVTAFGVACFLAWSAFQAGDIAGCGAQGIWDCSHVLHSRWSKLFGIPVGIPAAGLYLTMFVGLWFAAEKYPQRIRNLSWCLITILAVSAGAAAIWFISLQVFILQHLCKYCMVVHSIGLVIFMLISIFRPTGRKLSQGLSALGLGATCVLIVGQLVAKPAPTYAIDFHEGATESVVSTEVVDFDFDSPEDDFSFDAPVDEPLDHVSAPDAKDSDPATEPMRNVDDTLNDAVLVAPTAQPIASYSPQPQVEGAQTVTTASNDAETTEEAKPRVITYPGVRANLKVNHWPMIGSPEADQIVICLFDYTCPHCRNMSHHLDEARQRFGSQLSVVLLPVPLDQECNETVVTTSPEHLEACELSRLAIAVWRLDESRFTGFHTWLLSEPRSRTYSEALTYAQTIVDPDKLNATMNGKLVSSFIGKHVALYKRAGEGTLPKVLTEKMTIRGDMANADELCAVLQTNLGLQPVR